MRRWHGGRRRSARSADELRANGLAGSPAEVVDKIGGCRVGAGRVYLQVLDLSDLAHLELIAADVLPKV